MKVNDMLSRLGKGINYIFSLHWNFEEDGETIEKVVNTEQEEAVLELFGNWNIAEQDSIFIVPKAEDIIEITLYIVKPVDEEDVRPEKVVFASGIYEEDEGPECPRCGGIHELEEPNETTHYCFYCGFEWSDEPKEDNKEDN